MVLYGWKMALNNPRYKKYQLKSVTAKMAPAPAPKSQSTADSETYEPIVLWDWCKQTMEIYDRFKCWWTYTFLYTNQ